MRKVLLLCVVFAMMAINANAQFKLTSNGFVSTVDESKDYIVIDIPGTSKDQLFNKAKICLNALYNNPKLVTTEIENEQIVIDAIDSDEHKIIFVLNGPNLWQVSYKFIFSFKDDKIRFEPYFKCLSNTANNETISLVGVSVLGTTSGIYNAKGKCLSEKGKLAIEKCVNEYIMYFESTLKNADAKNDEW